MEKEGDTFVYEEPKSPIPFLVIIFGFIIVAGSNYALHVSDQPHYFIQSIFVFVFGLLAAYVELSSRYTDSPGALWQISATQLYLTVNALLSFFALVLIKTFDLSAQVDVQGSAHGQAIVNVITAVFSTQILFRSSLFLLKDENNGNKTIGGLSGFVTDLLELIDAHVDRHRAKQRSAEIHRIIPRNTSAKDLVTVVLPYLEQLLQNSDQKAFSSGERIAKLYEANDKKIEAQALRVLGEVSSHARVIKPILIGLELYNLVGRETLLVAMSQLKNNEYLGQKDELIRENLPSLGDRFSALGKKKQD